MITNNLAIREHLKEKNVRIWEVADYLKIGETTLSRRMRKEITGEAKEEIMKAIDVIAESR